VLALVVPRALAIVAAIASHAHVACSRCTVDVAGTRMIVSGTLAPDIELTAYTPTWKVGTVALRDVVIQAHGSTAAIHACAAGTVAGARVVACGLVARHGGELRVAGGRARFTATTGPLAGTALDVELAGTLSPLALDITGHARAHALPIAHATGVELPIDVRLERVNGAIALAPLAPLVAHAASVDGDVRLVEPVLVLADAPTTLDAFAHAPHALRWVRATGLPVELGAGSATVQLVPGGVRIAKATLAALGGDVAIDPFELRGTGMPKTMLHLHGLALARVLDTVGRGHVHGTGLLDGDVELEGGVASASLRARGRGDVQVHGLGGTLGNELRRVSSALEDFTYDRLALIVRPPGNEPESTLVLHGRGKHVPQELELTVHLRGARTAARSLVARIGR